MPRPGHFKGDADELVDALTAACKRIPTPLTALKERELVPFFSPTQAENAQFTSLQGIGKEGLAKAKPVNKPARRREGTSKPAAAAAHAKLPTHPTPSRGGNRSPPRKRQEQGEGPTPPPPSMVMYAGPGFTNSPLPESLPLPPPSLLLLDGLRRQLVL